ncbi:MAG: WD40 repeat domain-containing protein [Okeania sp. SIO3B3]|nr:WD40 repeat domain-containing protein [Okeania sp. SIO3B3]
MAAIDISPDGSTLAAIQEGVIEFFSTETGTRTGRFYAPDSIDAQFIYNPAEPIFAENSRYPPIHLRRISNGTLIHALDWGQPGGYRYIEAMAFSNDGTLIAASVYRSIRLWRVSDGTLLDIIPLENGAEVLAFSPDDTLLAAGLRSERIDLWHVDTGQLVKTLAEDEEQPVYKPIDDIAFSPDGAFLAVGRSGRLVRVWRLSDNALVASFEMGWPLTQRPVHVDFSPDGTVLALADWDGPIRLVNFETLLDVYSTD